MTSPSLPNNGFLWKGTSKALDCKLTVALIPDTPDDVMVFSVIMFSENPPIHLDSFALEMRKEYALEAIKAGTLVEKLENSYLQAVTRVVIEEALTCH